jgi:hypothetical protein
MFASFLFLVVHFFLALEAVAAFAIAALVFLAPVSFPYYTHKSFYIRKYTILMLLLNKDKDFKIMKLNI